ncbi:MAG: hypothetical protein JSU81_06995 [Candidatus Coatesbacteria bacterium]|nr:MAG: hypothetical protein JSU81_06995 [Candidatus Coatesbacteria bacterium]
MTRLLKTALACGAAAFAVCGAGDVPASRELILLYTGDSGAEIESCGCNLLAYGGLARRATLVDLFRGKYPEAIFVDVGDFFSPVAGEQARLKSEISAEAYGTFGYDAVNLGEDEFIFGLDFFTSLAEAYDLPVISANVVDEGGAPLAPPFVIVERGGVAVGLVGFVNPELAAGKDLGGAEIKPYGPELKRAMKELATQVDVIVCLAHIGNVDKAREFASRSPKEIDVVVAGHRGGRTPQAESIKGRWMVYTRSRNRYVGVLKLAVDDEGDVVAAENQVIPVTRETAKEEHAQLLVEKYYEGLRVLVAEKKLLRPPEEVPAGGFVYVGAAACAGCHPSQNEQWRGTGHASAYASLAAAGRERDPECVACHVTGYGYRGGFDAEAKEEVQVDVGCEECHGPGEGHASSPTLALLSVPEDTCLRCHDNERSPAFDFATYRGRVAH